jgi:hypothetical protein
MTIRCKITLYAAFFILFSSCNVGHRIVNLVVYTPFTNPQKKYDSIIGEISKTGLSDSIHVIGRPILISALYVEVDSQKAEMFDISVDSVYALFRHGLRNPKTFDSLQNIYINSKGGKKIPVTAIASFHLIPEYYRPEIYFTHPETYTYKERDAVKIIIYTKPGQSGKMIGELKYIMQKHFTNDAPFPEACDFEIVRE